MGQVRVRQLAARLVVVAGLTAAVAGLAGCGSGARDCEEAYTGAISGVEGVASVEAECSLQFGGGWQRVDVFLETNSAVEGLAVVEETLRAMAAEPGLDPLWLAPRSYDLQDGSSIDDLWTDLGFDSPPDIEEVREHYGIAPS